MADDQTGTTQTPTPATDAAKGAAQAGAKIGETGAKIGEAGAKAASSITSAGQSAATSISSAGQSAANSAADSIASFTRQAAEANRSLFADVTRMFSDMRFPTMLTDPGILMAAHRRNMDVLSQANRMALEGAQAVARRHMEIMQQTMAELTDHVRELANADSPQAKAARQAELVKTTYEHAVSNIRELSDLIQRSNGEAITLLNERFREAMDEIKQILDKATGGAGA